MEIPVIVTEELIETREHALRAIAAINEYCSKLTVPRIAVDCETSGTEKEASGDEDEDEEVDTYFPEPIPLMDGTYEGYLETVQIGLDPTVFDKQYIFNARKLGYEWLGDQLRPILESDKVIKIGQNLKYDWKMLWVFLHINMVKIKDTMLISQCENAGNKIKHNLGALYKEYIPFGWFKDNTRGMTPSEFEDFKKKMQVSDWSKPLNSDQIYYAGSDVGKLIWRLYHEEKDRLDYMISKRHAREGLISVINMECGNIPAYAMMELRGIRFDVDHLSREVIPYLTRKEEEAIAVVGKYFTKTEVKTSGRGKNKVTQTIVSPINLNSYKQVREALEPSCGKLTKSDEKTLINLKHKHPAIPWMLQARKASGLKSKFGNKFITLTHKDGRLHPSWNQIGSDNNAIDTGRSSCSNPNCQQIPSKGVIFGELSASKVFRRLFISKKGYKLLSYDYSNIEPTAAADITDDVALIEALNSDNPDLHARSAKLVLNLDYLPLKSDPRYETDPLFKFQRDCVGKVFNLATGYGVGKWKLAQFMWDNTPDDNKVDWRADDCAMAAQAIKLYYETYSGIKAKMDEIAKKVEMAFAGHDSLLDFAGRKVIYREHTKTGRVRAFYLSKEQEAIARQYYEDLVKYRVDPENNPFPVDILSKDYEAGVDPDTGRKQQNLYWKRKSAISREAYNFLIQGLCADIMKMAIRSIHDTLWNHPAFGKEEGIIAVIHDEVLLEVKEENVELAKKIVSDAMITAGRKYITKVPVRVEGTHSDNWAGAH